MKKILIALIVCSTILYSCHKDKLNPFVNNTQNQLPAETTKGADTFGCLVNGKIWVAEGSFSIPKLEVFYQNKQMLIGAHKLSSNRINLNFTNIVNGNTLLIKNNKYINYPNIQQNVFYYPVEGGRYYPDSINYGKLIFTKFDTINKIISGKFYFTAINDTNNRDTIKITDGRFDVRYR